MAANLALVGFVLSVVALIYASFGYLGLLWLLSLFRSQPPKRAPITPTISVIIAAHNEERDIRAKLDNTLGLDYPADRLEVIVFSDGSTDRTEEIVGEFADRGVRLHKLAGRKGKTAGQNESARLARGEILVFSDATTHYHEDALRKLVRNFADQQVACVGGTLRYVNRSGSAVGEGGRGYWSYERMLKQYESALGSVVGVSGCMYAVRCSVYEDIAPDLISDFVIALKTVKKGYRVVYEPEAICEEETERNVANEWRMRIRVAVRSYKALFSFRELLNPLKYGLFAVQLLSHKVLRYLVPFLLAFVLLTSALLSAHWFFKLALTGQLVFYLSALAGYVGQRRTSRSGVLFYPFYYCLVNMAALVAWKEYFQGNTQAIWKPER